MKRLMQGKSSHTKAKSSIYSLKSIEGYSPDKSMLKEEIGATHPSKMKKGKRVKENENYLPVRTKRIRTSGRNGYEHQTQSCQLEKEVKDQENGSDQKIDDLVKC